MAVDGAFISHALMWFIGALTAASALLSIGAFFSMGRSAYRKD